MYDQFDLCADSSSKILYMGNFGEEKMANLVNREPFATFYLPIPSFEISFSYTCSIFAIFYSN